MDRCIGGCPRASSLDLLPNKQSQLGGFVPELISIPGIQAVNPEQSLFRYMSLAKTMDLINGRRLFFSCIENLRSGDRNEGTVHADLVKGIDATFDGNSKIIENIKARIGEEEWKELGSPSLGALVQLEAEDKRSLHASCWHAAEEESILMWNRYASGAESIAIQTTAGDLSESLIGLEKVRMGWVNYDPPSMAQEYGTASECFYKYPIFSGEKEVRLVAYSHEQSDLGKGVPVKVDLGRLLRKIYVSPDADDWFVELVNGVLKNAGLGYSVHRTELKGPR